MEGGGEQTSRRSTKKKKKKLWRKKAEVAFKQEEGEERGPSQPRGRASVATRKHREMVKEKKGEKKVEMGKPGKPREIRENLGRGGKQLRRVQVWGNRGEWGKGG